MMIVHIPAIVMVLRMVAFIPMILLMLSMIFTMVEMMRTTQRSCANMLNTRMIEKEGDIVWNT